MPKVSIIIPVYNVEKYLSRCLDSVLNQTFNEFEAICVNDGSTDSCGDILDEYAKKDNRIKIITQKNQGVSVARNTGIQSAIGDYVAFLDSDDELAPLFLEKMYNAIIKSNADVVWCDYFHGEKVPQWCMTKSEVEAYFCPFDKFILQEADMEMVIWNKLWRRELVLSHPFVGGLVHGEDVVFLHQMLYDTKKIAHVSQSLYFYRERENSIVHSSFTKKVVDDNIFVVKTLHNYFVDKLMKEKTYNRLYSRLSKRLFKFCVLEPKRKDKANVDKWYIHTRQLLKDLKQQGIYQPQYLTLKNRIKSWVFLKGK
ncbi:MAG: glycosyltransferase [Alphaproteobacteria bacterium]|nr:glycosyltransferase [Alphaproteobacteria bacterium]